MAGQLESPTPYRAGRWLCAALVLGALSIEITGNHAMAQTSESFTDAMGVLRTYRTKAEHSASVLKGMKADLSPAIFLQAETLYVDARAAIDGWIEVFASEMASGSDPELSDRHRQALDEAADRADAFLQYVAALAAEDQHRGWEELVGAIPDTFTALVDGGIKLWKEFRSVGSERREALARRLDDLRWPPFEEVPAR